MDDGFSGLIVSGGTINGLSLTYGEMQVVKRDLSNAGYDVVLNQTNGDSSSSKGGAVSGSGGTAAGAPDPDDEKKPQRELSREEERAIRSYEKRTPEHEAKLMEFKSNPTVRPGMENQPQYIIQQQQAARMKHLETEIRTFQNNTTK